MVPKDLIDTAPHRGAPNQKIFNMPPIVSDLELLRRLPLLSLLSEPQAERILMAMTKRHFKKTEIIVRQHDRCEQLFVILTGRVRVVSMDKYGKQLYINRLRSGEIFDEMSLIDDQPYSATILADAPTDVLAVDREGILCCIEENGDVAHALMNKLVQRMRDKNRKIESLALMDVHSRVGRALVECAELADNGSMVVGEKILRKDLAQMVGASREMVSRVIRDFELQGFVRMESSDRMVLDRTWSRQFVELLKLN